MKFSEKLFQLRKKAGMSQEELAEQLEVSRQAISRWEMGTAMPDAPNLLRISTLFGISVDYLLHDSYESDNDIPMVKEVKFKLKNERKNRNTLYLVTSVLFYLASFFFCVVFIIKNDNYLFLAAGILYVVSASGFLYTYFKGKTPKVKKAEHD